MANRSCDVCGRTVKVAGGIANLWTFGDNEATGLTLELEDGSTHLLCYPCIGALPEHPTTEDVAALDAPDRAEGADASDVDGTGDERPETTGAPSSDRE